MSPADSQAWICPPVQNDPRQDGGGDDWPTYQNPTPSNDMLVSEGNVVSKEPESNQEGLSSESMSFGDSAVASHHRARRIMELGIAVIIWLRILRLY